MIVSDSTTALHPPAQELLVNAQELLVNAQELLVNARELLVNARELTARGRAENERMSMRIDLGLKFL